MFYVGLDIHTKHISICVLNQDGKVHRRDQVRQVDQLVAFSKGSPIASRFASRRALDMAGFSSC